MTDSPASFPAGAWHDPNAPWRKREADCDLCLDAKWSRYQTMLCPKCERGRLQMCKAIAWLKKM